MNDCEEYLSGVDIGLQTQQLQMLPMSNADVAPGATETQQLRVTAPVGVRSTFTSTKFRS